jgi:hypothetical protein
MTISTQGSGSAECHILRRWTTDADLLVGAQQRARSDSTRSRVQPPLSLLAWKLNSMRARPLERESR